MKPISKEDFIVILERQQQSGLNIKDFCSNEAYTVSSFYYWKSKFGFSRSYNNHHRDTTSLNKLAPVSFNLPAKNQMQSSVLPSSSKGEIKIKFPSGIHVSFTGSAQREIAMLLLNQICSAHVLPE